MAWQSIIGQERVKQLLRYAWESGKIRRRISIVWRRRHRQGCACPGICGTVELRIPLRGWSVRRMPLLPARRGIHIRTSNSFAPFHWARMKMHAKTTIGKLNWKPLQAVKDELQKKAADPYYTIAIPKAREIKLLQHPRYQERIVSVALGGAGGGRAGPRTFRTPTG